MKERRATTEEKPLLNLWIECMQMQRAINIIWHSNIMIIIFIILCILWARFSSVCAPIL